MFVCAIHYLMYFFLCTSHVTFYIFMLPHLCWYVHHSNFYAYSILFFDTVPLYTNSITLHELRHSTRTPSLFTKLITLHQLHHSIQTPSLYMNSIDLHELHHSTPTPSLYTNSITYMNSTIIFVCFIFFDTVPLHTNSITLH